MACSGAVQGFVAVQLAVLFACLLFCLLSLLSLSLEDEGRDELDELIIEDVEDLATDELEKVLLSWQVAVQRLRQGLAQTLIIPLAHMLKLLRLLFECGEGVMLIYCFLLDVVLLPEERAFEREGIHDVEFLEDGHSGGCFSSSLQAETAAFELEQLVLLAAHQGNDPQVRILDPALMLVILVAAAIEEGVLLP